MGYTSRFERVILRAGAMLIFSVLFQFQLMFPKELTVMPLLLYIPSQKDQRTLMGLSLSIPRLITIYKPPACLWRVIYSSLALFGRFESRALKFCRNEAESANLGVNWQGSLGKLELLIKFIRDNHFINQFLILPAITISHQKSNIWHVAANAKRSIFDRTIKVQTYQQLNRFKYQSLTYFLLLSLWNWKFLLPWDPSKTSSLNAVSFLSSDFGDRFISSVGLLLPQASGFFSSPSSGLLGYTSAKFQNFKQLASDSESQLSWRELQQSSSSAASLQTTCLLSCYLASPQVSHLGRFLNWLLLILVTELIVLSRFWSISRLLQPRAASLATIRVVMRATSCSCSRAASRCCLLMRYGFNYQSRVQLQIRPYLMTETVTYAVLS